VLLLAGFWLGGKLGDILLYGGALDFAPFQDSGSTVLGSIILVMVVVFAFATLARRNRQQLADAVAPPLLIAQIAGKIGCFFAGCCFGTHTDLPWAITPIAVFPPNTNGTLIHPVQLYEVIGMLLLLTALLFTRVRQWKGATAGVYLVCYGAIRFTSEFLRGDTHPSYFGITNGQILATLLVIAGALILLRVYHVAKPEGHSTEHPSTGLPIA
jgi:phosphatidylglycerol:prolipoprotein diacylglycerol transferase